jgi:GGDEF domain-containing protein
MDFAGITSDAMYRQAAEEAVAFFTSRDLLFEHGKYGICAILTGVSHETGFSKAEKFYQRISKKLSGGRQASGLRIGISSRSGRLLNADRMMMEATEALKKAKIDPRSPITAFKSDLEKYRNFIASQKQKAQ